ncbi:T9SS type A sorting domain-containing protein [Nostoc sp. NIES-2111]
MKAKIQSLLIVVALLLSNAAWSTDHTWTGAVAGAGGTAWSNSGNWSPASVPTSSDKVIIPGSLTGSRKFPIIGVGVSASCADIVFNSGAGSYPRLTCALGSGGTSNGNLTVYGNFTNSTGSDQILSNAIVTFNRSVASPPSVTISGSCGFKQLTAKSTNTSSGHSFTVSIATSTVISVSEYVEVTKGTGAGSSGTLSISGDLILLCDAANTSTAYVRAGSGFGTGEITGNVTVRSLMYTANNYEPNNSYDLGQRYHYLGSPVSDVQSYLQLDPDDGMTSPQFIYYKPSGYKMISGNTDGHPVYNSGFKAPGICKPILANYSVYQDYLDDFAIWAAFVENSTPYFQYYDETVDPSNPGAGNVTCSTQIDDFGYTGINKSSTSLAVLQGFLVNGAPANDAGLGGYLEWKGTVNNAASSNLTTTFTKTTNSPTTYDGRNLAANPFPSPIDWQAIYNSNSTNFNPSIQVWNGATSGPGAGPDEGTFQVFTACTTGCTSPTIPLAIGQGFFVTALNASSTLSLSNSHRLTSNTLSILRKGLEENSFNIQVSGQGNQDKALIRFLEGTSEQFDAATDLGKIMNPGNSIYSVCKEGPLHLNYLPFPTSVQTIPIDLNLKRNGTYTLSPQDVTLDLSAYVVVLEDKLLGKKVLLSPTAKYSFATSEGRILGRFAISFARRSDAGMLLAGTTSKYIIFSDDRGSVNIGTSDMSVQSGNLTITDLSGRTLYAGDIKFDNGKAISTNAPLPVGLYLVTFVTGADRVTQKLYLQGR